MEHNVYLDIPRCFIVFNDDHTLPFDKPAEQYDRLDRLFGTDIARLELFARTSREGWTAWGNETGKFDEVQPANGGDSHGQY